MNVGDLQDLIIAQLVYKYEERVRDNPETADWD